MTEVISQVADGIESVAFHPKGEFAVLSCLEEDPMMAQDTYSHLAVLDLRSKPARILYYVPVEAYPEGIAFTPDGSKLFVQLTTANHIAVFEVDGLLLKRSPFVIRVGHGPSSMALGPRFMTNTTSSATEKAMALWAELTECIQDQRGELAFASKEAQQAQGNLTAKELAAHRGIERNKAVLLRAHGEGWSKGNLDAIQDVYDENCVGHFNWGSEYKGVEAVKARVIGTRKTYPDWCETVNEIIAEGDFVATRWTSTGTHSGVDNPDLAGKKVSIMEIGIFRVKDGKIVEQWSLWDYDDLQQQLAKDRR